MKTAQRLFNDIRIEQPSSTAVIKFYELINIETRNAEALAYPSKLWVDDKELKIINDWVSYYIALDINERGIFLTEANRRYPTPQSL